MHWIDIVIIGIYLVVVFDIGLLGAVLIMAIVVVAYTALGGLASRRVSAAAAMWSMLAGGGCAILLSVWPAINPPGEPILIALPLSGLVLLVVTLIRPAEGDFDFEG